MRGHGRGGLLLVVPLRRSLPRSWRESLLQPVMYAVDPPFSGLAELGARRYRGPFSQPLAGRDEPRHRCPRRAYRGGRGHHYLGPLRSARVRREDRPPSGLQTGGPVDSAEPIEGAKPASHRTLADRGYPAPVCRAIRARSTERDRDGGLPGRPLHRLRLVALRRHGPRPSH